jgi:transposase
MGRAANGQAILASRLKPREVERLRELLREATVLKDLATWRRAKCVLGYIDGRSAITLAKEIDVDRSAIAKWTSWYNAEGADGLRTRPLPGRAPRLSEEQRVEVSAVVEAGPQAAGFQSGMWTGALVGQWIEQRFGVHYHPQHIPRLLHQLGFSVQRPRKRLARADLERQAAWLRTTLPAIKKKPTLVAGPSSSRTKPASGSTARSTKRGVALASNRA